MTSIFMFLALTLSAQAQEATHEEVAPVTDAVVPARGPEKAVTSILVSGVFRNGCVHFDRAFTTRVDERTLEVRVLASVVESICTMARVPYTREVQLESLPAGEHTLVFVSGDGSRFERTLVIE